MAKPVFAYAITFCHNGQETTVGVVEENGKAAEAEVMRRYQHLQQPPVIVSKALYTLRPATVKRYGGNVLPTESFKALAVVAEGHLFYVRRHSSNSYVAKCGKMVFGNKICCRIYKDDHDVVFD